jgi:hypothetical protein
MTYMTPPPVQDSLAQPAEARSEAPPTGATAYRLRRMGARPLVFRGVELGMAMSFAPDLPYWYEVNLYHTVEDDFVLAIRLFHQSEGRRDTVVAWRFDSLADAFDALEGYDAAQDVPVALSAADDGLAPADLAAHALDLRAQADARRQHFAGLVGEFLHQIDLPA